MKICEITRRKDSKKAGSSKSKNLAFYMFPKIHKRDNPGRPVISLINCHTTNISQYAAYNLQPHVKELKP